MNRWQEIATIFVFAICVCVGMHASSRYSVGFISPHFAGSSSYDGRQGSLVILDATIGAVQTEVVTHEVFMPALSSTMKEGKIVAWHKAKGDAVAAGDIIMTVESDKADMEVESFEDGYLAVITTAAGSIARVGETVGLIAERLEDVELIAAGGGFIPSGDGNRHDGTTTMRIEDSSSVVKREEKEGQGVPAEFSDESSIAAVGAKEVFMPALSSTMTEGKISKWLKREGDKVEAGDIVMIVESDKADMDVESFENGVIAKILVPEGSYARVGATCALIASSEEDVEKVRMSGVEGITSGSGSRHDGTTSIKPISTSSSTKEVFMPALSSTMTEGKISKWLKREGDKVEAGDIVMIVESDKADMEVESFEEGYLSKILVPEGGSAAVGTTVALLVENEQDLGKTVAPKVINEGRRKTDSKAMHEPTVTFSGEAMSSGKYGLVFFVPPSSLDQDLRSQTPPEFTGEKLSQSFLDKLKSTADGREYVEELQSTPKGKKELQDMMDRQRIKPPPSSILLQPKNARPGSLFRESNYVRKLADKHNVDVSLLSHGSGPSGKITQEDVLLTAAKQRQHGVDSEASSQKRRIPEKGLIPASPSVRQRAKEMNVDIFTLQGTGPFGRVTLQDVEKKLTTARQEQHTTMIGDGSNGYQPTAQKQQQQGPPGGVVVPMDAMQKTVANNMGTTLHIPVFRVSRTIRTDAFDSLYKEIKVKGVTLSSMLAKAVGVALREHPIMNAAYDSANGGSIRYSDTVNIATAVAIDGGLLTPVLKNVVNRDLYDLSRNWKDLVDRARQKKLQPTDYNSGTFYVSNLGMLGVNQVDPILPPGAGCIMGVGTSMPKVSVQDNGFIFVVKEMTVTLSCDHRHIYGAHASEFLQTLADVIERRPLDILTS